MNPWQTYFEIIQFYLKQGKDQIHRYLNTSEFHRYFIDINIQRLEMEHGFEMGHTTLQEYICCSGLLITDHKGGFLWQMFSQIME